MKVQYQVTLIDPNKKYRPISCLTEREQEYDKDYSKLLPIAKAIRTAGIQKILAKRGWIPADLLKFGYTEVRIRKYDKEKIAAENEERYNKLKAEKFASGEWKPTKKQKEKMEGESR